MTPKVVATLALSFAAGMTVSQSIPVVDAKQEPAVEVITTSVAQVEQPVGFVKRELK